MKLAQIIRSNNWLSVEMTLLKLYPDQSESIEAYKKVYGNLQEMKVDINDIKIEIDQEYDDETGDLCFANVYGVNEKSTNEITNGVAIEFEPWSKWLGMTISERTCIEFNELEIIAHCLWEMTYMGYDENEIQSELCEIKNVREEYMKLSEEEKKTKTKSIDDFENE
ncbi:DUF6557 family protein [Flavobacterium sp.]|uniref:DUF6557 family protein n=1 Tax=Flavobacterium sp. TaxID=239 RepID=UPI00286DF165|nr:DUF6557 family protein [Flavobacterium sp.]